MKYIILALGTLGIWGILQKAKRAMELNIRFSLEIEDIYPEAVLKRSDAS